MDQINHGDFLTADEVSALFRIPLRTIYNLSKSGKIKGVKIGKQWRYKESEIKDYINLGTDFSKEPARKPNNFIERRTYPRINSKIDCRYLISITNLFGSGVIKNISAGGVFLAAQGSIETDDPIDLVFKLEDKDMKFNGRIVRKDNIGLGIKYRNVSGEDMDRIIKYVG